MSRRESASPGPPHLYLDRLSRVPALTRLLEHVCKRFGVAIVALDTEDSEDQAIWQKELLGYITVWCNRQSAQKSVVVCRKDLSPECVARAIELRKRGFHVKAIYRRLGAEGFKTSHGDAPSYGKVLQLLDGNGVETALTSVAAGGRKVSIEQSCHEFIKARIVKDETGQNLTAFDVYPEYAAFCKAQDKIPQPCSLLGKAMVQVIGKYHGRLGSRRCWQGYVLR
jgi:hypothetical protein